jgi:hypothetical protein
MQLKWSEFIPGKVWQAEGHKGVYLVRPVIMDALYLMPKGEPLCPVNPDRALRFVFTNDGMRTAQEWEDD